MYSKTCHKRPVKKKTKIGIESWLLCLVCLPGLVIVVWLFLAVPLVCLHFVFVVFPDHTHLLVFKTDYRSMQVTSIAECSKGSILQYFLPSLSYRLSLRPLFCLFFIGPT